MKSLKLKSVLLCFVTIAFFSFFFTSCEKATDFLPEDNIEVYEAESSEIYSLPERMNDKSDAEVLAFIENLSPQDLSNLQSLENDKRTGDPIPVEPEELDCDKEWTLLSTKIVADAKCPSGKTKEKIYVKRCRDKNGNLVKLKFKISYECVPVAPGPGGPITGPIVTP